MSRLCKRSKLLQPGEISELIFDTDSYEERVSSDVSSVEGDVYVVEGGAESVPGLSQPQPTTKQSVVTTPAVQFHPVPLTKKMLVRMCQVNRLNSQ